MLGDRCMNKLLTKKNASVDEFEVGKKMNKAQYNNTCLLIRILLGIFSHGLSTVVVMHICSLHIIEVFLTSVTFQVKAFSALCLLAGRESS